MPDFDVTAPDGTKVRVNAPDGATQDQAIQYAQTHFDELKSAGKTTAPAPAPLRQGGALPVGTAEPAGAGVKPVKDRFDVDTALRMLEQTNKGFNESSLLASGLQAGARAATGEAPIPTPSPRTLGEGLARGVGTAAGVTADYLSGTRLLNALPGVKTGLQTAIEARPAAASATIGAGVAGGTSAAEQYANTGTVDPKRVAANEAAGGVLGALPPSLVSAFRKLAPSFQKSVIRYLTGKSAEEGAKMIVPPTDENTFLSETTPAARPAAAKTLTSEKAEGVIADKSAGRVNEALKKLSNMSGDDPVSAISKLVNADVKGATGSARAAQAETGAEAGAAAGKVGKAAEPTEEGHGLQKAITSRIDALKSERDAGTKDLLVEARDQADHLQKAGHAPDAAGVANVIDSYKLGELPISDGRKLTSLHHFLFGAPEEGATTGFGFSTEPLGKEAAGGGKPTWEKLFSAREEVKKSLQAMKANPTGTQGSNKAALTELEGALTKSLEDFAPKLGEYRAKYAELSDPINQLTEGGSFLANAAELQKYGKAAGRYEQNPATVADSFVREGKRGAEKIKDVLGEKGEPFVRGYFARQIGGADAAQLGKTLEKNSDFLREFPAVRNDLETAHKAALEAKGVSESAEMAVKDNLKRGLPIDEADAHAALTGLVEKGDRQGMRELVTAVRNQDPANASALLRDAVATSFRDQLRPILQDTTDLARPRDAVVTQANKAIKTWNERRDLLTGTGAMTKEHAASMDAVMGDLRKYVDSISRLPPTSELGERRVPEEIAKHALQTAAHGTLGYTSVLLARGLDKVFKGRVDQLVFKALTDPAYARELSQYGSGRMKPTIEKTLARVSGYGAIPTQQELQQQPGDTNGNNR